MAEVMLCIPLDETNRNIAARLPIPAPQAHEATWQAKALDLERSWAAKVEEVHQLWQGERSRLAAAHEEAHEVQEARWRDKLLELRDLWGGEMEEMEAAWRDKLDDVAAKWNKVGLGCL